ncbi:MAG: methylated-DNA--[protein]-cysteine S-methyltransferase [Acidimicrobiia bacterium]|nr:methylated-DNA--[protein]-cysteine S-methyltransferase [Acidimicrobiia bacterium]
MTNTEEQLRGLRAAAPNSVTDGTLLGTGLADGYAPFDSPLGEVIVSFNLAGVSSVDLPDEDPESRFAVRFGRRMIPARPPRGWEAKINRAIERGTPGDLPVDLRSVTPFRRAVLEMTAAIPRGQVRSYGWLAVQVGNEGATRAVGSTMASNPVPLIVPCHRVVRADGTLGNYSLGGPENKRELLAREGTDPDWLESLAGRGVRYVGSDTTHVVCHPTCSHARRITASHRVEFGDLSDATSAGFRPCQVCRPVMS